MTDNKLPIWRQELKSAIEKEGKSSSSKWVQLATVNNKNEPRLRTVVFRGWKTESSLLIFTDKRSKKIEDLKYNPNAELLWLFFKSKRQFRFKGIITELIDNKNYWIRLSDISKSTWFWEYPGKEITRNLLPPDLIPKNLYKPKNFVVLQFDILSVDLLKLVQPIHKRYLWEKKYKWNGVEINP